MAADTKTARLCPLCQGIGKRLTPSVVPDRALLFFGGRKVVRSVGLVTMTAPAPCQAGAGAGAVQD
jgi:hypothetical protein